MSTDRPIREQQPGALVISLDFELHWGVRARHRLDAVYERRLRRTRAAVPQMLGLFREHGVHATWATVGLLFARDRADRDEIDPSVRPAYRVPGLDPYAEPTGDAEADDPFHYAGSLIRDIQETPGQELATHTYSHLYAMEDGVTEAAFDADLDAAVCIAARDHVRLASIVFPRNEVNERLLNRLLQTPIRVYRGNPPAWMYRAEATTEEGLDKRLARLADAHLPVTHHGQRWDEVGRGDGLADVRASTFLRPLSGIAALDRLHEWRVVRAMAQAARRGEIYHLWWHPHNFGERPEASLARLRRLLQAWTRLRDAYGMQSFTMHEAAEYARHATQQV